ncbi:VWA domain-containing protein [Flavobacteriaceae bacterium R38]|nr:VWA domain-containing protein [Flavobacteriaceae bacterium R38]
MRSKGFSLTSTEETDALQALTFLPFDKEENFKHALKAILSKTQHQYLVFDDYYDEFWDQLAKAADSKTKDKIVGKDKKSEAQKKAIRFESLKDWLNLSPSEEEKEIAAVSDFESLTRKNFSDLSEEELQLMMRLLQKLARKLAHEKSRLLKTSKKKRSLDLKKTIRANMRKGGQIQHLLFSQKKERKLKLVLLCDVSRSMDLYSRFFIHLIYAFQHAYDKIETFVFSTALHRVSTILDQHEFDKAFDIISERVPQWSGGTTIGSCLSDFTKDFGHGMLDRKTIVMILSDGWDTGEPEVIESAMKTLYKKSKKVIWLNPLAGNENFSPDALGMKTALPYIDILTSAHNLESLKKVMQQLQKRRNFSKEIFIR